MAKALAGWGDGERQRGAASVEHVGLVALVALLVVGVMAAVIAGGEVKAGRDLARTIGKRLACGPRLPDACSHHELVPAYGWPLARLVRAWAPAPVAVAGLAPIDFRRCRRESCAVYTGPHLTASNRRTTLFTEVATEGGWIAVTYWAYRPTLGWERLVRRASAADVAASSGTAVLESADPALVPLETLPGRNHYEFPPHEAPPWQWTVRGRYPGWSS